MAGQKLVPISIEELGRFSVGEQDKALYLDGGKVQTTSISLTAWQARLGIAAAIAAVIGALSSAAYTIGYFANLPSKKAAAIVSVSPPLPSIDTVTVGCVGPFASGKGDVLETTSAGQRDCDTLDAMKTLLHKEKTPPSAILFVGAADKFPASPSVEKKYGSNDGLAQARAEWVANQLGLKGSINSGNNTAIVSLVRGAEHPWNSSKPHAACSRPKRCNICIATENPAPCRQALETTSTYYGQSTTTILYRMDRIPVYASDNPSLTGLS